MDISWINKLLILFAIIISVYILYSLVQTRNKLIKIQENFSTTYPQISSCEDSQMDLSLKQYFIFSSWNSCLDSNGKVTKEQLKIVMQNGCRFLDFEIYNSGTDVLTPSVGYSEGSRFSPDMIPLSEVFEFVINEDTPNPTDPLFLHFRIKEKTYAYDILEKLAEIFIQYVYTGNSYIHAKSLFSDVLIFTDEDDTDNETDLFEMKNSVVIILDTTNIENIVENTDKHFYKIYGATNAFGGSSDIVIDDEKFEGILYKHVSLLIKNNAENTNLNSDGMEADVEEVIIAKPNMSSDNNISLSDFKKIINSNVQIIPYKFYQDDANLAELKDFISNNHKRAFVPLVSMSSALDSYD